MKVRIKIQHDPSWRSDIRRHERYWVNLPDGSYFPIFSGAGGNWYQVYALYMDYPSAEAAIAASLRILFAKSDGHLRYKRIRHKEQVFTFNDAKCSRIKLPRLPKPKR